MLIRSGGDCFLFHRFFQKNPADNTTLEDMHAIPGETDMAQSSEAETK